MNIINGMTILEQTSIKEPTNFLWIGLLVGILIMLIALFYIFFMEDKNNTDHEIDGNKVFMNSLKIICVGFIISMICILSPFSKTESGRYKYECTFEDHVTVNDITEVYDIISVEDDIWTVQDKNIEKR